MVTLKLKTGREIGGSNPCYIIAEIGQNHQGDMQIAKKLIEVSKEAGVDCVKLQKSNLKEKFNAKASARPYQSPNSWGKTYGEHKSYLEFSEPEFIELKEYANSLNIDFSASGMDLKSVDFLSTLNVPFLKVASNDTNSIQYLSHAASKNQPLFISSGMQSLEIMTNAYKLLKNLNAKFCFLQCTSSYPTPPKDVNLRVIQLYQEKFPDVVIGYSGHELGVSISIAAVALGAKVLERHITLNKCMKGSDHSSSLDPQEMKNLVSEIRSVEKALGVPVKEFQKCEQQTYDKLGKTLVARMNLNKDELLTLGNICAKVADPKGIPSEEMQNVVGRRITREIMSDESIFPDDLMKS